MTRDEINAELCGIAGRHTAEIRRLGCTRRELRGHAPASTGEAIERAATASLNLVIEVQRVRAGVQR